MPASEEQKLIWAKEKAKDYMNDINQLILECEDLETVEEAANLLFQVREEIG